METETIEFTQRELQEIKTALLLDRNKTMSYGFVDDEVREIMQTIGTALEKINPVLSE